MSKHKPYRRTSRRVFLQTTAALVGATALAACGGGEEALNCNDTSGLTEGQRSTRTSLGYVEASPHGATKNCANCNFYTAAAANQCGSCTLIQGPINPSGYCNSWAEKQG